MAYDKDKQRAEQAGISPEMRGYDKFDYDKQPGMGIEVEPTMSYDKVPKDRFPLKQDASVLGERTISPYMLYNERDMRVVALEHATQIYLAVPGRYDKYEFTQLLRDIHNFLEDKK